VGDTGLVGRKTRKSFVGAWAIIFFVLSVFSPPVPVQILVVLRCAACSFKWSKVYDKTHPASWKTFQALAFPEPVVVPRGSSLGVYVHSTLRGDEAIV
jgi:hypothetical protein